MPKRNSYRINSYLQARKCLFRVPIIGFFLYNLAPIQLLNAVLRLKFLFDLLPVLLFFGTFKLAQSNAEQASSFCNTLFGAGFDAVHAPVICATAVAVAVSLLQIGWMLAARRKVEPMLWISFAVILIFGGLTIWLKNEMFIKWKPTILYWLFAAILIGGKISGRNFIRSLLSKQISMGERPWNNLLAAWTVFFIAVGALNLFVAYSFSTDTWVNFKLFGLMGLTLLFTLGIGFYIARFIDNDQHSRGKLS